MSKAKPGIAILSPSQNAYSETFIQAHKECLNGRVFYYYGERNRQCLQGEGRLLSGLPAIFRKLMARLSGRRFGADNAALMASWKQHDIQLVLAEYGTTGSDYRDIVEEAGLPLIVHFHGFDASMHETLEAYKSGYRDMFEYSSAIIVVSEVMHEKLLALGCPARKLKLNHYGPNPAFHSLKTALDSQQFIAVGRFTEKKAPKTTITAFSQVLGDYPQARLVMAGNGSLLEECKALTRQLGIEAAVEFAGVISAEQFTAYLQSSLAFVQHSVTASSGDMEGTPLTVLEASAAGLPVLSTRHAGIPDVIVDQHTGFLVEEHDVDGMARSMKSVLEDPGRARAMGQRGAEHIATNFSLDRHIRAIDEIIAEVLEPALN